MGGSERDFEAYCLHQSCRCAVYHIGVSEQVPCVFKHLFRSYLEITCSIKSEILFYMYLLHIEGKVFPLQARLWPRGWEEL